MKVEFVEFYPLPENKNKIHGTLHIYIIDYKLDIRGIYAKIQKGRFCFRFPYKTGYDPESNEKCFYPIVSLCEPDMKKLVKILKIDGEKFVNDRLNSGELKFPTPRPNQESEKINGEHDV